MTRFDGQRVALLESRKSEELAVLVQRMGGRPICVPTVREVLRQDDVGPVLSRLAARQYSMVAVLTAAALEALLTEADRRGRRDDVIAALRGCTIAARGPKPLLSLRRCDLQAQVVTAKPHTSEELLTALASVDVDGRDVLVLHYGERSATASAALAARGARVEDLCLYEWALPEDLTPLRTLVRDTLDARVDAVLFTSQVQLRHFLLVASGMDLERELIAALRDRVTVASIGPVCSRALRSVGVIPDVMPAAPNSPSLISAVAEYLSMFRPPEETAS